jgi:hypothetical protein
MASALRGPQARREAASPPLISRARRSCYGAAPPASRVLRIALRATALRAAPETTAAPGSGKSGQARACPAPPAARKPRRRPGGQPLSAYFPGSALPQGVGA